MFPYLEPTFSRHYGKQTQQRTGRGTGTASAERWWYRSLGDPAPPQGEQQLEEEGTEVPRARAQDTKPAHSRDPPEQPSWHPPEPEAEKCHEVSRAHKETPCDFGSTLLSS